MGNRPTREVIYDTNYIESLPADISCLIAEKLSNYDDIMLLYELYPKLRSTLFRCVREIFTEDETEVIWDADFFLNWTNLERTNVLIRVHSQDEMDMVASLRKLKTHRIILDFDSDLPNKSPNTDHKISSLNARVIRLFDDYLTLHLRNAPETEEIVLIPVSYYKKNLVESLMTGLCFSYVNRYHGYTYVNNIICSPLFVHAGNVYFHLLYNFTGRGIRYVSDAKWSYHQQFNDELKVVTEREVPRFLSIQEVIVISDIEQQFFLDSIISHLAITTFAVSSQSMSSLDNYIFYFGLLSQYPHINEFRVFTPRPSKQFSRFVVSTRVARSNRHYNDALARIPPSPYITSLDFSYTNDLLYLTFPLIFSKFPNLKHYTFYHFDSRQILLLLNHGIDVDLAVTTLSSKEREEVEKIQAMYPNFNVVPPKTYLIPQF